MFPGGTAAKVVEERLANYRERGRMVDEEVKSGVIDQLISEILDAYSKNPNVQHFVG
jgi:intracellular multiplication protein IcmB